MDFPGWVEPEFAVKFQVKGGPMDMDWSHTRLAQTHAALSYCSASSCFVTVKRAGGGAAGCVLLM